MKASYLAGCITACFFAYMPAAKAITIQWIDWQTSLVDSSGFTAAGVIISGSETVDVTYHNPQGVGFFYDGVGSETDFWAQQTTSGRVRIPASSPYTSVGPHGVDNIPTGTDMIALRYAGSQTLTFSQPIANLVFAYVSLNGNGYGFDQDFELLSSGGQDLDGQGVDDCGWWGCGTSTKQLSGSSYLLTGTGEPHGALRFTGVFNTLTWNSLTNEYWNGFTIGVQGTASQVVPLPASAYLLASGLGLLGASGRRHHLKKAMKQFKRC